MEGKYLSVRYKIFRVINIGVMLLVIAVCLYPYLHIMAKSFNDAYDTILGGITVLPRKFTLFNYSVLLADQGLVTSFGVTLARVIIGTVLSVTIQYMTGYALSRNVYGKKLLLTLLLIPSYFSAGLIPTYILYRNLHLMNNFLVYILPGLFVFYNVMLIRVYITSSVPDSMADATKIDGGGEFTIMTRIYLPLCKPAIAMVILFTAVGHWNDWVTTLYFVTRPNLFTLQYKLMQVIKEADAMQRMIAEAMRQGYSTTYQVKATTPESLMSAQIIATTLPIILVYPFLQKYFVNGIMIGAVKE